MSSSEFFTTPVVSNGYTGFELLRESGFNKLYSVERDGKRFVVKSLAEEYRGDLLYESLLRKEFEIGYSLDHPNICRTLSFEIFPNVGNGIVMEWLDGRTLDKYIIEKRHDSNELQRIVEQLCGALSYAHKRQTIHRDLKPQNIIITHNGDNVKLLDFGLSDTDHYTALKEPAGSRRYAAPELQKGDKVDLRSDIYSLGVIINELYKGQISRKISRIVAHATALSPDSRYADSEAVVTALKDRNVAFVYPLLIVILAALGYLFYMMNRTTETPIPSVETDQKIIDSMPHTAEVDQTITDSIPTTTTTTDQKLTEPIPIPAKANRMTAEEIEKRQACINDLYNEVDNSYVALMNDSIYIMNCATPQMPNFEEISRGQMAHFERIIDSMLGDIKESTLYLDTRRNISSHNQELITNMRNVFPALFWLNTETLYQNATDSLAQKLQELPGPDVASNYDEMSYEEQQAEDERYLKAVDSYDKSTVVVWAIDYRERHGLAPLPDYLLNYYDSK